MRLPCKVLFKSMWTLFCTIHQSNFICWLLAGNPLNLKLLTHHILTLTVAVGTASFYVWIKMNLSRSIMLEQCCYILLCVWKYKLNENQTECKTIPYTTLLQISYFSMLYLRSQSCIIFTKHTQSISINYWTSQNSAS